MEIVDKVWGRHEVNEPALLELLESDPVQRLKKIAHYGLPEELYFVPGFSRYEHSVGVMLALKELGAGLDEQAAGLLHDVSHTTFSHVIDFVVGSQKHDNYQDNKHEEIINNSDIPNILRKHGMDVEKAITLDGFTLLEFPAPDVCADRLDYAMREFAYWSATESVEGIKNGLTTVDGKIAFCSIKSANMFARKYMQLHTDHWAGVDAVGRYHILAATLREALKDDVVKMEDFWGTDEEVMNLLRKSKNTKIKRNLEILHGRSIECELTSPNAPNSIHLVKKFRYVDPLFYSENSNVIARLSEADSSYRNLIAEAKEKTLRGFWFKE